MDRIRQNLAATKILWIGIAILIVAGTAIYIFSDSFTNLTKSDSQTTVSTECFVVSSYSLDGKISYHRGISRTQYFFTLAIIDGSSYDTATIEVSEYTYGFLGYFLQDYKTFPCTVTYDNGRIVNVEVHDKYMEQITQTENLGLGVLLFAGSLSICGVVWVLFGHRKE